MKERVNIFASLLNLWKIKEAMRFICKRETKRVLLSDDIEEKLSSYMKKTPLSKHSEAKDIDLMDILHYKECLDR